MSDSTTTGGGTSGKPTKLDELFADANRSIAAKGAKQERQLVEGMKIALRFYRAAIAAGATPKEAESLVRAMLRPEMGDKA